MGKFSLSMEPTGSRRSGNSPEKDAADIAEQTMRAADLRQQMQERTAKNQAQSRADLQKAVFLATVTRVDNPQVQDIFDNSPIARKNGWTGLLEDGKGGYFLRDMNGKPAYPQRLYSRASGHDPKLEGDPSGTVSSYIEERGKGPINITPAEVAGLLKAESSVKETALGMNQRLAISRTDPLGNASAEIAVPAQAPFPQPYTMGPNQQRFDEKNQAVGPRMAPAPPAPARPPSEAAQQAVAQRDLSAKLRIADEIIKQNLADTRTGYKGIDPKYHARYGAARALVESKLRTDPSRGGAEVAVEALKATEPAAAPPAPAESKTPESTWFPRGFPSLPIYGPPAASAAPLVGGMSPDDIARQRVQGSAHGGLGMAKMDKTMHEFKQGALHSGSARGPLVKDRRQAIAIGLSQRRRAGRGMAR